MPYKTSSTINLSLSGSCMGRSLPLVQQRVRQNLFLQALQLSLKYLKVVESESLEVFKNHADVVPGDTV